MYISRVTGKSKKVHPISAETLSRVEAAVGLLFQEGHSFDSMQYHFISSILERAKQSKLSKTKQAEQVLLIHKTRLWQLAAVIQKMKPVEAQEAR